MCGIAGIAGPNAADYVEALRRMIGAQSHRGPDGDGVYVSPSGNCVLGHRRLSILDLSTAAAQPMHTLDGMGVIVYNGELYNFQIFRDELAKEGVAFTSTGDTQVLAELLKRRGASALQHLNGMFGLALWDEEKRSLLIARDRFGQKPVYYARVGELLVFASEIRSLLASGLIAREVDPQGLESFLAYGAVQSPHTIVRGVRLLPSASYLLMEGRQQKSERYWHFPREKRDISPEALREGFRAAVERHLVSDAPIGLFLSGGIDSSAIAAAAVRSRTEPVISLSVIFPEEPAHSEERFARIMAQHAGTEHREVPITGNQIGAMVLECLQSMDQPTIDSINTYVVAFAAREAGLKVALSGLGGDELFGGYPVFSDLPRLLRFHKLAGLTREPVARLLHAGSNGSRRRQKLVDVLESPGGLVDLHLARRRILSSRQIRAMSAQPLPGSRAFVPAEEFERLETSAANRALPDAVGVLEMQTFMEQMLLRDSDVMGMANSLEIRVPFLDADFADLVLQLGPSARVPSDPAKKVFVDAMADWLPRDVTHRPKQGFTFPFVRWVQRELSGDVEKGLRALSTDLGIVKKEPVEELWTRFRARPAQVGWSRPWVLYVLSQYLQKHGLSLPQEVAR